MLRRLLVRNYVLIDSLDIEFPEGLVIITGQTGAGKSILLGALNLVLGARADASVIGEGGGNCIVEAEFSADLDRAGLRNVLQENDIDCPDGILTVRRVVNPTGRSRSFVRCFLTGISGFLCLTFMRATDGFLKNTGLPTLPSSACGLKWRT